MKSNYFFLFLFALTNFTIVHAQKIQQVSVMHYNILNYNNFTSYCTSTNNDLVKKNIALKKIINFVKPDIFTVNEMHASDATAQMLLDNALNVNGTTYYRKAKFTNVSSSDLANMLFYNKDKLKLLTTQALYTSVRDINIYKLMFNTTSTTPGDTVFLNCFVVHLKAGNTENDAAERANATQQLMNFIISSKMKGNFLLMGDMNLYKSSETAFQNLINPSNVLYKFYDPINQLGNWYNNNSFSNYHTQSTHVDGECHAGGGMDDRFDFILVNNNILNSLSKISYVQNSYYALGQDGNHYNSSINDSSYTPNTNVSSEIANALYDMSDHLPVILKLSVDGTFGIENYESKVNFKLHYNNPISEKLIVRIESAEFQSYSIVLRDISGSILEEIKTTKFSNYIEQEFNLANIPNGVYILQCTNEQNQQINKKIIKFN